MIVFIAAIFLVIVYDVNINHHSDSGFAGLALMTPAIWILPILKIIGRSVLSDVIVVIFLIGFYFAVGAFIGSIYGKFKNRNKVV
mgnify:CR=1 FL=1